MSKAFSDYIRELEVVLSPRDLPLSHTFDIKYFKKFCDEKAISNEYLGVCDVFNKLFLYFFYGRPAFKLYDLNAYPACFIFRSEISDVAKIFPFDSGAYVAKRMETFFGDVDVEEFNLGDKESIHKVLKLFYESPDTYFDNKPERTLSDKSNKWVNEYHRMITEDTPTLDDRKSAIELIFEKSMELDQLALAIIPANMHFNFGGDKLHSNDLETRLKTICTCEVRKYTYAPAPKKNYVEIYKNVKDFILSDIVAT